MCQLSETSLSYRKLLTYAIGQLVCTMSKSFFIYVCMIEGMGWIPIATENSVTENTIGTISKFNKLDDTILVIL